MTKTIKAVAYYSDGGDGSGGFSVYNSVDELKADMDFSDERMQEILDEDDPYENGEVSDIEIQVEEVDGELRLAKDFYLHWGQ